MVVATLYDSGGFDYATSTWFAATAKFSIVLLSTLGKGQSIAATNMGWQPEGEELYNYNSDAFSVVHTAVDDEPPGTVLTHTDFSGTLLHLNSQDQLLVYQGAQSDPTFLCAFDWSGNDWQTTD